VFHLLEGPSKEDENSFVFGKLNWENETCVLQDLDHGRLRTLMTGSFTVKVQLDWDKDVYLPTGGNE